VITATIVNGKQSGVNYTQDFSIAITDGFVPVTDIIDLPTGTPVGEILILSGKVVPDSATDRGITWSVKDAGGTGARITNNNRFNNTAKGIATVTATVPNGKAMGVPFTKDFHINVGNVPGISGQEIENKRLKIYPNPTNGQLQIINYELSMGNIEIYDIVGRKMIDCELSKDNTIDVSPLENGLYFLKIGNRVLKIVKK
jgi:hypothetical protein